MNSKKILLISKTIILSLTLTFVSMTYASEVTGTLSSASLSSVTNQGNTGNLSGTVVSGGSLEVTGSIGGGGGGGNGMVSGIVSGGSSGGGIVASQGGGTISTQSLPQGEVLGASTGPRLAYVVTKSVGVSQSVTQDPILLSDVQVAKNQNTGQLANALAASSGFGAWYWWVLLLIVIAGISYYLYRRYYNKNYKSLI